MAALAAAGYQKEDIPRLGRLVLEHLRPTGASPQRHPRREGRRLLIRPPRPLDRAAELGDGTFHVVLPSLEAVRRGGVRPALHDHGTGQSERPDRPLEHGAEQPPLERVRADVVVRDLGRIDHTPHDETGTARRVTGAAVVLEEPPPGSSGNPFPPPGEGPFPPW